MSEELRLAQFALFSLYYVTKPVLADQQRAEDFYQSFMAKSEIAPKVGISGIRKIIEFARLGEKALESEVKRLQEL